MQSLSRVKILLKYCYIQVTMQALRCKGRNYVLGILGLMATLEVCRVRTCSTASGSQCEKAPFVPGHNLAGEGFDVVRMRRTGAYVISVKGHMTDNHTCTLCPNRFQQGQVETIKTLLTLLHCLNVNSTKATVFQPHVFPFFAPLS